MQTAIIHLKMKCFLDLVGVFNMKEFLKYEYFNIKLIIVIIGLTAVIEAIGCHQVVIIIILTNYFGVIMLIPILIINNIIFIFLPNTRLCFYLIASFESLLLASLILPSSVD